jgi:hypothetical protein
MKNGDTVFLCENGAKTPVVIVDKWSTCAKLRVIGTGKEIIRSLSILEEVKSDRAIKH